MNKFISKLLSLITLALMSQNMMAQEVIFSETFENGFGGFTVEGYNGPDSENAIWLWTNENTGYVFADAFGKVDADEFQNYLVSPSIKLFAENVVTYDGSAFMFNDRDAEIGLFIREAGATEWTKLEVTNVDNNMDLVNVGDITIPSSFDNKTVQFGFMYTAIDVSEPGVWMVDNFVVKANTEVPNKELSVLFNETFENGFGGFAVEGYNGPDSENAIWSWTNENTGYVFADAFGKVEADEFQNYLVSPSIKLLAENVVTYDGSAFMFNDRDAEIGLFIREAGATEWTKLEVTNVDNNMDLVNVGDITIPSSFDNKTVQFGFMYTAIDVSEPGVWMIDNFVVKTASDISGIEDITVEKSANDNIYDLQGRRIINPAKGIYIQNGKKVIFK